MQKFIVIPVEYSAYHSQALLVLIHAALPKTNEDALQDGSAQRFRPLPSVN